MFISCVIGTIYFINTIFLTPALNIETIVKKKSSKIYDNNNTMVKQLTMEDYENITYDDLPDVFINALLSCEDVRYFMHEGIDLPRILSALKNDALSFSLKEGASTLTQQLIKNMMLTNKKSISRKIQEIYLANNIEKLYSKKEIIEFYCNYVCFDGVNHGISSASHKFFDKAIKEVTLPEAALLAGIVNAPTAYSPLINENAAFKRKNIVLDLMYKHGFINKKSLENAKKIEISDMLVKKEPLNDQNTYPYQAYIDIVYQQIFQKTGYDPYIVPMEIYTYMDSSLQNDIDNIQNNNSKSIIFNNDLQQFASSIIDNDTGAIIASFGGRNYNGQKLYNRSYDLNYQPGSTIKVILEYALAFQYLNYNSQQILNDTPYNYPNSTIEINNVDKTYMGEITIAEALGYSRNTTAIKTLKEVIDNIGQNKVIDYLKSINLMDEGSFSYSYGLGGYTYGVSLTNLAAAYSMIARNGLYIEPLAVKRIKLLDGSNIQIDFIPKKQKVLSDSTCYLLTNTLMEVMEKNIWSIKDCKPQNINIVAKTGTTSFDKTMLEQLNYPQNASKDKLLASYSKDYTIVSWTGFDNYLKDKQTYFSTTNQTNVLKEYTKLIYKKIAKKNQEFIKPNDLVEVDIVKGSTLLATSQVEPSYVVKALFKKDNVPTKYFEEPLIEQKVIFDYFIYDDELTILFNDKKEETTYHKIFDYDKILGGKNIYIDIYENGFYKSTIECKEKIATLPLSNNYYQFDIYYKYKNGFLDGIKETISFTYN